MALPQVPSPRLIAVLVAVLAVVYSVFTAFRAPADIPIVCPWGRPVAIRSYTGALLAHVGEKVELRPPVSSEDLVWIIRATTRHVKIQASGGNLTLQDSTGNLHVDDKGEPNDALWWVEPAPGGMVRFLSWRQMNIVNSRGSLVMSDNPVEGDVNIWSIHPIDGSPGFHPSCWPKKVQDTALNDGWLKPHQQTPDQVPQPSILANYSWKPFYNVTEEDVRHYDEHGFTLLKQVVEPEVMDLLYKEAENFCASQIKRRNVCQIEMLRWQLNTFRDFLFYGPLGKLVHSFTRGSGVRVSTEALFGTVFNKVDPPFFSYQFHTDAGNQFGVFHGFNTGTKAAAAWFPLHDVDAEVTGGGIKVVDGYPSSICKYRNCNGMLIARGPNAPKEYNCPRDCFPKFGWKDCGRNGCKNSESQRILSFKKGDIVIWHSDMPHATQSTKQAGFARYAFTVRFVDSDAVMCDVGGSCGGWMACCKDAPLKSGIKLSSHCWPKVYPQVLEHEVQAHYSDTPKFMIADAATENAIHQVPPSVECAKPANAKTER